MLMLCVYTCTQTHSCTVYLVVMSNIGTNMYGGNIGSLIPRPHWFIMLQFVLTLIKRSRRAAEAGKARDHSSHEECQVGVKWAWGRGPPSTNAVDHQFECSAAS